MDLEGFTKRRLIKGIAEEDILEELDKLVKEFKNWSSNKRQNFSRALYQEVTTSLEYKKLKNPFIKTLLDYPKSGVAMGEFGVGSRGEGDFFVHKKISEIIGNIDVIVGPKDQDDAGVVECSGDYVTLALDGTHSRLSDFPFLAGFHAARAALRDVCVMGSNPVAMMSDLHLADDGDIGKLFDFTGGVSCIGDLTNVPLVSGSTLRVGGDMVFGDRLVSGVAAVGVSNTFPKVRRNAENGDIILLTKGSGGGTITTIAIYNKYFEIIKETLNVEFTDACYTLFKNGIGAIHTMCDITNGGIRGDASEISRTSGKKFLLNEDALLEAINKKVLDMLIELEIDPLGISTDSLMLILPEENVSNICKYLKKVTKIYEVGHIEEGNGVMTLGKKEKELKTLFRESPYTKVKQVVGQIGPKNIENKKNKLENSRLKTLAKKREVSNYIRRS
mgnify:CR=1 FL=1